MGRRHVFGAYCGGPGPGDRWCPYVDFKFAPGVVTSSPTFGDVGLATDGARYVAVATGRVFTGEGILPIPGRAVDVAWTGNDFVALTVTSNGTELSVMTPDLAVYDQRLVPVANEPTRIVPDDDGRSSALRTASPACAGN